MRNDSKLQIGDRLGFAGIRPAPFIVTGVTADGGYVLDYANAAARKKVAKVRERQSA